MNENTEQRLSDIEIKIDKLLSIFQSFLESKGYRVEDYYVVREDD